MHTVLLLIGAVLPLIAAATYVQDVVRGSALPQRMTRLLLTVITGLSFASLLAGGDRSGLWLALASFVECAILWVLSWRHGIGGRNILDVVCLCLCAGGITLWAVSGESVVGLVASIIADCIACMPSLVKTVRLPHTEPARFYLMGAIAGGCILAAGPYEWRSVVFPLYIMAIDGSFVLAISLSRRRGLRRGTGTRSNNLRLG